MPTDSGTSLPLAVEFTVWGASWWGDAADVSAALAEHRPGEWLTDELWDKTIDYLDSVQRWHGTVRLPIPWWWALACAPDLVMQGLDNVRAAS